MKFVFDLDGTICFNGGPVSPRMMNYLKELSVDHEIIFASARPIRDLLPVIDPYFYGHTLIGGNGALISQQTKISKIASFSQSDTQTLLYLIEKYQATYLIDSEWNYAYTGTDNHPIKLGLDPLKQAQLVYVNELTSIVKVLILTATDLAAFEKELLLLNVVYHFHGDENVIDISPQAISKWSALEKIGIKTGEFIAFGNDQNDISMFKEAKIGIQVGTYKNLTPYASETLNGQSQKDIEEAIIEKLDELKN
ncbi:HAD-IIB family hydrolase [Carnobacterium maltaromaticum]|uniref:HAD-IIB family hydrolase n=1 Tax=Carnobacterium maltaromaticum TaxID=2751 RepID=UPI001071938D|nr:HAD-IIB family hydrolase [Carnobacterium maltaromaticum]TFJ75279.1 HAD family hydrolase [Carnobacterium maltaromaticum]TFJ78447.1 HAD family hydrolase [Carnobacterium maltaromaticum]CAD5901160.1 HAD-superhydrolase, subIIB family protein [Carnobacterium maltaromaticum]